MFNFIIFIFLFFYFILSVRRLDWALMFLLAALPSYQIRFSILGIPMTFLEAMILIVFGVWLAKNYKQIISNFKLRIQSRVLGTKFKIQIRYPFDIEIFLLLIVSWIAIAVAGFSNEAMGVWKAYFFEPVLVYILIINIFGPKRDVKTPRHGIFIALAIGAFWVSGLAIIESLTGWNAVAEFWPRVTGPFVYPNALGLFLGPLTPLLGGYLMYLISTHQASTGNFHLSREYRQFPSNKFQIFKTFFLLITILASIIAIVLARSEGALIGVLATFVVMGLFWLAGKTKKKIFYYFNYFVIAIILIFVFFSSFFFLYVVPEHKYFNFKNQSLNYITDKALLKDLSGEIRKQQWRETGEMMKAGNWLLGAGLSNYRNKVEPYHQEGIFFNFERDKEFRTKIVWFDEKYKGEHWQPVEIYMYPHNLFLNFWTEIGLAGALLFIWIIGKFIYLSVKQNNYLALGLLGAMLVIAVHGLVDVPYFKNDLSVMFWVFIALLGLMEVDNKLAEKNDR